MEVTEFFTKGGPVMYLLLISTIAVAAIGIERFRFYSYASHGSEHFLSTLKDWFTRRRPEEILSLCTQENSSVGLVAAAGVKAAVAGESVELALNVAYDEEAMKLRARLNYLSMIVTLAPLLGLLGTISGMIESFNIFSIQAGQPLAITGGIGEALIATATGLCVSIFALLVHTYFAQKLDESLTGLDRAVNIVLANFSSQSVPQQVSEDNAGESEGIFQ